MLQLANEILLLLLLYEICIENMMLTFYLGIYFLIGTAILTWILGAASKRLRLFHGRVGDSTIVVNSLSPQMSELVEDAIAS